MATEHTVHCGASRSESVDSNDHPLSVEEFFKIGSIGGPSEGEVGPKRRGPKPDLTPAKNEKVERNRKAQRSHRERKERYIRNLEQEVQRLRGAYTAAVKEKMTVVEENRQLHALLKQRGINFSLAEQGATVQAGNNHSHHTHQYQPQPQPQPQPQLQLQPQAQPQPITAEQYSRIAINLVLALEKLCLDHIQKLSSLSTHNRDYIQGHVLMVSCPPATHTLSHPDEEWGLKTVDLDPEPLNTLLNMQVLDAQRQRYLDDLDGELTPMAAWTKTTIHPRFHELTLQDFDTLMQILPGKVGCHGFGAVIEEAEVEDALEFIFAKKDGRA